MNRSEAMAARAKTYEGSAHAACGTTTKYTWCGGCVKCHQLRGKALVELKRQQRLGGGHGAIQTTDDR